MPLMKHNWINDPYKKRDDPMDWFASKAVDEIKRSIMLQSACCSTLMPSELVQI